MNSMIFWRLAWKEYRQQRDLFVAILVIALAILGIMLAVAAVENRALSVGPAYAVALMMPIFYALGCGATLFAGEHDRETFDFLRSLPHLGRETFWSKVLVAILTSIGLTVLLALSALVLTRGRPLDATDVPLQGLVYVVTMVVVLSWTIFYSLLMRNPLWAIAAAGISFFAALVVPSILVSIPLGTQVGDDSVRTAIVAVLHLLVFVALLVANIGLGNRWLTSNGFFMHRASPGATRAAVVQYSLPATATTRMLRLLWQTLRESGYLVLASYAVVGLASVFWISNDLTWTFTAALLPSLLGSFTFFHDQRKQNYRFFSEQGVAARSVWWNRILATFIACLPWLVVVAIAAMAASRGMGLGRHANAGWLSVIFRSPVDFVALGVLGFACAQWSSLVFRAGIVGISVGMALGVFSTFIVGFLRMLGIPDWLGVYSLAAILFWGSWYRAPDWLTERDSWRRWLGYTAVLSSLLVVYLAGLAAHRAYEIPDVAMSSVTVPGPANTPIPAAIAQQHQVALAELMRPTTNDELETARLYRAVWSELRTLPQPAMGGAMGSGPAGSSAPMPGDGSAAAISVEEKPAEEKPAEDKSATERQERLASVVDRFIEISHRGDADFASDLLANTTAEDIDLPMSFLRHVGERVAALEQKKEFDKALECYLALLRFARHYQQRGDWQRIMATIKLEEEINERLVQWAASADQSAEKMLALDKTLRQPPYNFQPDYDIVWLRDYTILNALAHLNETAWQTQSVQVPDTVTRSFLRWQPWERQRTQRWINYSATLTDSGAFTGQPIPWSVNTLLGRLVPLGRLHFDALMRRLATDRSARQIRLLLITWKQEHGELPQTLSELGKEFGEVPLNPSTNQDWVYRPNGIDHELSAQGTGLSETLPAHTPFIWSGPIGAAMGGMSSSMMGSAMPPASSGAIAEGTEDQTEIEPQWQNGTIYRIFGEM